MGAYIKHYFWVYMWGSFQMRLAFKSVDAVKYIALFYGWADII